MTTLSMVAEYQEFISKMIEVRRNKDFANEIEKSDKRFNSVAFVNFIRVPRVYPWVSTD